LGIEYRVYGQHEIWIF